MPKTRHDDMIVSFNTSAAASDISRWAAALLSRLDAGPDAVHFRFDVTITPDPMDDRRVCIDVRGEETKPRRRRASK